MRIAVVGTGIAGMVAARALAADHDLEVYEAGERVGGHTNTVPVTLNGATLPVDTGFIVFNELNYPDFAALLRHLDVSSHPTRMSFALSLDAGAYEYSGSGLAGFFGQPANLACAGHWRLLAR